MVVGEKFDSPVSEYFGLLEKCLHTFLLLETVTKFAGNASKSSINFF